MQRYNEPDLSDRSLEIGELLSDPFDQFDRWFKETCEQSYPMPHAMSLATSAADGLTTLRTVLLKHYDHTGFIFYTNYLSRKGRQIRENSNVSLLFPWVSIGRQIVIIGAAEKISQRESLEYFQSRPRGSQIGAWASAQSHVIESRDVLEKALTVAEHRFNESDVTVPNFWGGYRVVPDSIEFWQNRVDRLHDRFVYQKIDQENWKIDRLAP